jgi:prolyl 4-hydroxylase
MSKQIITAELRRWIVAQAAAGVGPDQVLAAMKQSGWDDDVALDAIEVTLEDFLRDRSPAASPVESALPTPQLGDGLNELLLGEHPVSLVVSMQSPRLCVFDGFLSDGECDEMTRAAAARLTRSETVQVNTGGSEVNPARTSEGMFFERGESALCTKIEARIAMLVGWPVERGEGLQVLRYQVGAEYKPHFDYFDPLHSGTPAILARGGQRVATVIMYLNTPAQGGATVFPDAGLTVAARKGRAVFFSYDRADPSARTLHGGAPVLCGEKWVATKWLRQGRFD